MRAAKVDRNQAEIVGALRAVGASVQPLHRVGEGCPDLLVGFRGRNLLIEVKDGELRPSARTLNPRQERWHEDWRGEAVTVATVDEALSAIGVEHHRQFRDEVVSGEWKPIGDVAEGLVSASVGKWRRAAE